MQTPGFIFMRIGARVPDGGLPMTSRSSSSSSEGFAPRLARICDFLFETGMLRKTPRSGYQFLGSGRENVAEHSYRACMAGLVLAELAGLDEAARNRVVLLCLFHDFHEARTGDPNYVNKRYVRLDENAALEDALEGTGLHSLFMPLWEEFEGRQTPEARIARDADQIDLMLNLREEEERGNPQATAWLDAVQQRLQTPQAKELAGIIRSHDHTNWWQAAQVR